MEKLDIYLATVCLERNRWGSREPSFSVSNWLPRLKADGFDGIELWENHFLAADPSEREALVACAAPVAVYNSYARFDDDQADQRARAAAAVRDLKAAAVKYNLGGSQNQQEEYEANVLKWADELPDDCRLLCECHPGTVLEDPAAAAAYFADLDPQRHGAIGHVSGDPEAVETWFAHMHTFVAHLHVQMRTPKTDPSDPGARKGLDACFEVVKKYNFQGTVSIEFTRGIGRDESIDRIYENACRDMTYCRKALT